MVRNQHRKFTPKTSHLTKTNNPPPISPELKNNSTNNNMGNYTGHNAGFGPDKKPSPPIFDVNNPSVNQDPELNALTDDPTIKMNEVGSLGPNETNFDGTEKKSKIYEESVYFHNLKGRGQTKEVKIKTSFKANDQQLRILGAMELQKDPQWQERTKALGENAGIKGESYVHGSQNKKWMKKGVVTNAQYYHGNTFNHMSNASGDYIKLSSDGRVGMNKDDPKWTEPLVDKNKNPKFVKRNSGYKPPTYGDRGLTGIGRISSTGFAGGIHKKGTKKIDGSLRVDNTPYSFTRPKKGYEKVFGSTGIPQWMKGMTGTAERNENIMKKQRSDRSDKLSRKQMKNKAQSRYDSIYGSGMSGFDMSSDNEAVRLGMNLDFSNPQRKIDSEKNAKAQAARKERAEKAEKKRKKLQGQNNALSPVEEVDGGFISDLMDPNNSYGTNN